MTDSLTDIRVEGSDVAYTDTGDLGTVAGFENVVQSAALDVAEETKLLVGGAISSRNVRKLKQKVVDALNADPQLSTVVSATIDEVDRSNNTVTLSAQTIENDEFTIDLIT